MSKLKQNMKVIVMLIMPTLVFAQIGEWIKHTIDDSFTIARSVYAIDLDGDHDNDILGGATNATHDVTWWENDGHGNLTSHPITDNYGDVMSSFAIDLNGDTYIDVLVASAYNNNNITWWENDGASPPGFIEHVIDDNFTGAWSVYAIDLDGDNDIDVLGSTDVADDVIWWENDGNENFTKHTIADNFDGVRTIFAIDLDDDTDNDVLGVAFYADDITWWENDGNQPPSFTEHTIKGDFDGASSVFAIDLDGDTDIDVLGTAMTAADVTWWENDGNQPPSFTEHTISGSFSGANSVYAIDLDDDEDVDVLGAAFNGDAIAWWENDGSISPNFTSHGIDNTFDGASSVFAIDLDQDTDVDVLGTASIAGDIVWWEKVFRDAGPISIDIPLQLPEDTTLYPIATVKNFGNQMETFLVTCEIEPGGYLRNRSVNDLAAGDSIQITFFQEFTFDELGTYTVKMYTRLENDENLPNDTMVIEVMTFNRDVGVTSIDIPVQVPEFSYLVPQATVKNYGTTIEAFDVTCEINPGAYTSVFSVDTLVPGDSVSISFEPSFVLLQGTYTVLVYTNLPADMNFLNDTLEKVIETYDPGVAEKSSDIPFSFGLRSNPVKSKALFNLALPEAATITLRIYDVSGRLVANLVSGRKSAGYYEFLWDSKTASGIYFYKFESAYRNEVGKLILVK